MRPQQDLTWARDVLDRRRNGERVSEVQVYRALVISGDCACE